MLFHKNVPHQFDHLRADPRDEQIADNVVTLRILCSLHRLIGADLSQYEIAHLICLKETAKGIDLVTNATEMAVSK